MNNRKPKSLVDLFLKQKPRLYKKGQIILRPDDNISGIYYIEKGFVRGYSLTKDGSKKTHLIYKAGNIFPVVAAFSPKISDTFFETIESAILRKIEKNDFFNLIKKDNIILFEVIQEISMQMKIYVARLDGLEYIKANSRIIDHLLFLSEHFGKKQNKNIFIQVPLTHQDIAESTAISRETVSREIELLKRKNLIINKNKHFIINDLRKLKKELNLQQDLKKL